MSKRSFFRGLGGRILLALVVVSLVGVGTVAVVSLIGSDRGVSADIESNHAAIVRDVANAAGRAYDNAGGWKGADLSETINMAQAAGSGLLLTDANGNTVASVGRNGGNRKGNGTGGGNGTATAESTASTPTPSASSPGRHKGNGRGRNAVQGHHQESGGSATGNSHDVAKASHSSGGVSADVIVDSKAVGTLSLTGLSTASTATPGRSVTWSWIIAGAVVAVVAAIILGVFAARRILRPLRSLSQSADKMAAGDYTTPVPVTDSGEVRDLAEAFEQARCSVLESQQRQRETAANVAHELSTPLTALRAELEELRDGYADPSEETLARLHRQTLRMARTVKDLTLLADASNAEGDVHSTVVDLGTIVGDALEANRTALHEAGLVLTESIANDLPMMGDSDRLHQVMNNLLSNCIRYCRPGDTVDVAARRHEPGCVEVVVADTGPGIPASELSHVTERFWRGRRDRDGSGIGLTVVQSLVSAHKGEFIIESDGENGVRTTARFPASRIVRDTDETPSE